MQCLNTYTRLASERGVSTSFCVRELGHKGDCRGHGVQWDPKTGRRRKKPTMSFEKARRP